LYKIINKHINLLNKTNKGNKTIMSNENKISVDELLKRKRERNESNNKVVRNNIQNRNKQIAERYKADTKNILLGEAQIDLQNRLLDAEDRAICNFNDNYETLTANILEELDAKADMKANEITSAIDVEYQLLEEVRYEKLPALAPRQNRFSNMFLLESKDNTEEIKSLKGSTSSTDNEFQF
jgi:hypothetical protein